MAYYRFDEGVGKSLMDSSTYGERGSVASPIWSNGEIDLRGLKKHLLRSKDNYYKYSHNQVDLIDNNKELKELFNEHGFSDLTGLNEKSVSRIEKPIYLLSCKEGED